MRTGRKISTLFFAIAISLTISCETKQLLFDGPYFVRFTEDALIEQESYSKSVKIEVHNAGPAPKSDVIVDYVVSGSAREGIDYVINGTRGKVKIKSGEYFGYIDVSLINNSNNILESQDVIFTLQSIEDNANDLRVGQGASQIGKSFTLTIEDVCLLEASYYGIRTTSDVPIEDITITSTDPDCEDYILSNWDIYVFNFASIRSLTFKDNGDNTLTIPPQHDPTLSDSTNLIDGSGVVDPTSRIITFKVRLVNYEDQPSFEFQLIPD